MFKLIIQDDEGKTTVVPLIRDEITIGRKEGNTIRLTERNISRKHARIMRDDGQILLEDLESYNGVRVNGQKIDGRAEIRESDRIQIGDYLLEIRRERQATKDPFGEQATDPMPRAEAAAELGAAPTPRNGSHVPGAIGDAATYAARPASVPGVPPLDSAMAETADTMPSAGVQAQAQAQATAPARLVVMSSNFAGREFTLDKAAVVIGRTEDNDVVIDHRSISRHHAKVVKEKERFAIVDLQSSNGVRVNGEEYGKVELRRGDLIDLGHVRFRFVEPGEDFVFERDGTVVDLAAAGGGRSMGKLIGAFVVLGAAVMALVILLTRSGDGPPTPAPAVVTQDATAVRPVVDPPPAPRADSTAAPDTTNGHILEARQAVEDERWKDAETEAHKALVLDPQNEEAGRLSQQARRETANKTTFDEFQAAHKRRDFDTMKKKLASIPEDSVYRDRAAPMFDEAKSTRIKDELAVVEDLAAEGKCKEVEARVKKAARELPDAADALNGVMSRCKEAVVDRTPPDRKPPKETPPKEKEPKETPVPDAGTTTPAGGDFDALFEEARKAFAANQDGKALTKAEAALDIRPGDQNALSIAAYAACRLKRAEVAKRYYERLRGQRQQNVKAGCSQVGIFF